MIASEASNRVAIARARSTLAAAGIEGELPTATDAVQSELREVCAWTLREGITNVIRHSGATSCRVTLRPDGIAIADNGSGPRPGSPGTGLVGLRERAEAVGLGSAATLRLHFRRALRTSPVSYRRRFSTKARA